MAEPTTTPTAPSTPPPAPNPQLNLPTGEPPKPSTPAPEPKPDAKPDPEFDDAFEKSWQARQGKKAEPPKEPDKPADAPPPQETPKPAADALKTAQDKPQDKTRVEGPKALREERDKAISESRTLREELNKLKSSLGEHETKAKEAGSLATENAKLKTEIDNLKGRLQAVQFEVSDEFKAKYETPFNDAAEIAQQEIEQFPINVMDADGNIASQRRGEFGKDFAGIYGLDYISAKAAAQKLWGDEWQVVMQHWSRLHSLDRQRGKAMETERTNWKTKQQEREAENAKQREAMEAVRGKVWQDVASKHPEWFGEDPNDPEGNEMLKEGYDLIRSKPNTMQEQLVHWANTLHRAAAFPRMASRVSKLQAEVDSLKAKIEELKSAGPGPTKATGSGGPPPAYKSIAEELREAMAG